MTTTPQIKSFLCGTDDDGKNTELNICISVPDGLTATSVLGHIALLCSQYVNIGHVPVGASSGAPAETPAPEQPEAGTPTVGMTGPSSKSAAPTPTLVAAAAPAAATTKRRTAAKKAPTNNASPAVAVAPAPTPTTPATPAKPVAATIAATTPAKPVAAAPAKSVAVVPAPATAAAAPEAAAPAPTADAAAGAADVPAELKTMKTFSNVLLWLAQNVSRDIDELVRLVQEYRPHVPSIARTDAEESKVKERIERGIGVLVARGSLEAA